MTAYFDELGRAMAMLAEDPRTIFMGQAVEHPGTAMFRTLERVPADRRLELPVAEDMQMGMAIGMALEGLIPVCIYPRINFLLLAVNQLVLHLDKMPAYSRGEFAPKVIIRTAVGSDTPLDPGPQHIGDYSRDLKSMMSRVLVRRILVAEDVVPFYETALVRPSGESTLLVEYMAQY